MVQEILSIEKKDMIKTKGFSHRLYQHKESTIMLIISKVMKFI